jgi:hypothetical protein
MLIINEPEPQPEPEPSVVWEVTVKREDNGEDNSKKTDDRRPGGGAQICLFD